MESGFLAVAGQTSSPTDWEVWELCGFGFGVCRKNYKSFISSLIRCRLMEAMCVSVEDIPHVESQVVKPSVSCDRHNVIGCWVLFLDAKMIIRFFFCPSALWKPSCKGKINSLLDLLHMNGTRLSGDLSGRSQRLAGVSSLSCWFPEVCVYTHKCESLFYLASCPFITASLQWSCNISCSAGTWAADQMSCWLRGVAVNVKSCMLIFTFQPNLHAASTGSGRFIKSA